MKNDPMIPCFLSTAMIGLVNIENWFLNSFYRQKKFA
jgi:hypothetical protein